MNKEKEILDQAEEYAFSFCCVALLYVLFFVKLGAYCMRSLKKFSHDTKVQVSRFESRDETSDTMKMPEVQMPVK